MPADNEKMDRNVSSLLTSSVECLDRDFLKVFEERGSIPVRKSEKRKVIFSWWGHWGGFRVGVAGDIGMLEECTWI